MMSEAVEDQTVQGEVLFNRRGRSEENGNDIWDDTALIRAYDNAVSKIKAQILNDPGAVNSQGEKDSDDQKGNKKKHRSRKRGKRNKGKWRIGMQCRTTFSEDGLVYDATIISLNEEEGLCIVRYDSYGNEEQHNLTDLRRPRKRKMQSQSGDGISEYESNGDAESSKRFPSASSRMPGLHQQYGAMPPPPPMHAPMSQSFGNTRIPFIPPPPPPISDDPCDQGNEAMCSMLMAWYMSGYHTGYYQGLKDGRRQGANNGQSPSPDTW